MLGTAGLQFLIQTKDNRVLSSKMHLINEYLDILSKVKYLSIGNYQKYASDIASTVFKSNFLDMN